MRRVLDAGGDGGGTACEQEEENEARRCAALWRFQVDTSCPSECLSLACDSGTHFVHAVRLARACGGHTKPPVLPPLPAWSWLLPHPMILDISPHLQAKLWEDNESRKLSSTNSTNSNLASPLATDVGAQLRAEPAHHSNAKVSTESATSLASNKTRFSLCDLPPQHSSSTGANPQPLVRAPRPLGVPRYQVGAHRSPVPTSTESKLDFSLPLPVLPTEKSMEAEKRSKKISVVAPPPSGHASNVPNTQLSDNPPHEALALPTLPNNEELPHLDDESVSMGTLEQYLEELSKSPHYDEYLCLLRREVEQPRALGTCLSKPFTFSYFKLYKLA